MVVVRVQHMPHAGWEILVDGRRQPITCETLGEACRVARRAASQLHPCELLVLDAYERVVLHESIDGS
jgi:hypothetical protein